MTKKFSLKPLEETLFNTVLHGLRLPLLNLQLLTHIYQQPLQQLLLAEMTRFLLRSV